MSDSIRIRGRVSDLWRDDCGWSENGSWTREAVITVPAKSSDLTVARRIKSALGVEGMKVDNWCHCDFGPWRYQGIGAYADIIQSEVNS